MNAFLSESQSLSLFLLGAKQIADAIWGRSPLSGGLNKTLLSPSFVSPTMKKSNHTRRSGSVFVGSVELDDRVLVARLNPSRT